MTTLILWEANDSLMPIDREERRKLIMSMLENVKKSVDSGEMKMWGVSGNADLIRSQFHRFVLIPIPPI